METKASLPEKFSLLLESSKDYVENKIELEVLKGADKIAQGMSVFATYLAGMAMGLVILCLLCVGFAIWINKSMQSAYVGYFIVSAVLLIVLVLIFSLGRKQIKKVVINTILNNIDND